MTQPWVSTPVRKGWDGNFFVKFSPKRTDPIPFMEAVDRTAASISNKYGNSLQLCLSGGTDSEFILRTFVRLGLPVRPVVLTSPFNLEETSLAFRLCDELATKAFVIQLTEKSFAQLHVSCVKSYNLKTVLGATPLLVHSLVGGSILTGYGDPIHDDLQPDRILLPEWDFYTQILSGDHPGPFFTYDQEIFQSYMSELRMDVPVQQAKCELYQLPSREKLSYDNKVYELQRLLNKNPQRMSIDRQTLQEHLRDGKELICEQ